MFGVGVFQDLSVSMLENRCCSCLIEVTAMRWRHLWRRRIMPRMRHRQHPRKPANPMPMAASEERDIVASSIRPGHAARIATKDDRGVPVPCR